MKSHKLIDTWKNMHSFIARISETVNDLPGQIMYSSEKKHNTYGFCFVFFFFFFFFGIIC
jgi:hypothetical protein